MKPVKDSLKEWSRKKNFLPKLISILLAVILWGYLTNSKSGEVKFKIPVNFVNIEPAYTVSRVSGRLINVRVSGRKDDLKSINSRNIKLFVDLSDVKPGEFASYPVQIDKTEISDEVTVEVTPSEVRLYIEKMTAKNLTVIPRFSGDPEKGIIMGRVKVNPDKVRISGAESILAGIDAVYTDYINLDDRQETFRTISKLAKISDAELEFAFTDVNVTVSLYRESETRVLELPLAVKNRKKGFDYDTVPDKVSVRISQKDLKETEGINISAFIDAAEIQALNSDFAAGGSIEKEAEVHIKTAAHDDSGIVSVMPEKIKVIITRE